MKRRTAFVCDESYFWHNTGNGALFLPAGGWIEADVHSENPATKRRVKNLLERSGFIRELVSIPPRAATEEEIAAVHDRAYIKRVEALSQTTGDAGELAVVGYGSFEIACLSAGGGLRAVDAVMRGEVDNAYVLHRPPGHHAERDKGMGFCLFNNVAVAARYAQRAYGLKRIAIVDWDVHHGNGTESIFYDDPGVLFVSLHQENNYPPGRGCLFDTGAGAGEGYTINIPLPAGTSDAGYLEAIRTIVAPVIRQFGPELIFVSAGQDASLFDPLGRMMVTAEGFYQMAQEMLALADECCHGRLVACHEGGYSAAYVPFCTLRVIEALAGIRSAVEDPFAPTFQHLPTQVITHDQRLHLQMAKEQHVKRWSVLQM
jgi:acetoin utilization deacetylase AcuC-like enzyme